MPARTTTRRRWLSLGVPLAAAVLAAGGIGAAQAGTGTAVHTHDGDAHSAGAAHSHADAGEAHSAAEADGTHGAAAHGRGDMEFGLTDGAYEGGRVDFTYSRGFWCDTSVSAASTSGCEAGAKWKKAPSARHDPLFITVPLGFTVPMAQMDCPDALTCVDHPPTMDLTRLATALAPVFKTTPAALTPALRNFTTPGHNHLVTDLNGGEAEWWDVYVVGVTNRAVYDQIQARGDYGYVRQLIAKKNPYVVGPIPTNLFLYFQAR